jgi:hypothetical protein
VVCLLHLSHISYFALCLLVCVTLCSFDPAFARGSNFIGTSQAVTNPAAQVAHAVWWTTFLTLDEVATLAAINGSGITPAAFTAPQALYIPVTTRVCPSQGTAIPLTITLPHYYGGNVWLSVMTVPAGLVNVSTLFWNTSNAEGSDDSVRYVGVNCSYTVATTRVIFAFMPGSDTQHYTFGQNCMPVLLLLLA